MLYSEVKERLKKQRQEKTAAKAAEAKKTAGKGAKLNQPKAAPARTGAGGKR